MMGITGKLRTSVRVIDLHRAMQTTSQLLLWVMGKIKGLKRGYAVSYCRNFTDCTAIACTDGSVPISYTFFIKHPAQPTKHQRQSSTVCRGRTFSLCLNDKLYRVLSSASSYRATALKSRRLA